MKQLAIYHDNKTKPSLLIEQKPTIQETMESYLSSYQEYLITYNNQKTIIHVNEIAQTVQINKYPMNKPDQIEFVSQFRYEYVN